MNDSHIMYRCYAICVTPFGVNVYDAFGWVLTAESVDDAKCYIDSLIDEALLEEV